MFRTNCVVRTGASAWCSKANLICGDMKREASTYYDQVPGSLRRRQVRRVLVYERQVPVCGCEAGEGANEGEEDDDEGDVGAEGADEEDEADESC